MVGNCQMPRGQPEGGGGMGTLGIDSYITAQFELCFPLMEHISVISCRNLINLYITEKIIKLSKSLFNFYLVISNK